MIKVGDIVICIKDHLYENKNYNTYSYTTNHGYIIKAVEEFAYYIEADTKNEAGIKIENSWGIRFSTIKEDMNIKKFGDYFITLAEYREQQMKIILDE